MASQSGHAFIRYLRSSPHVNPSNILKRAGGETGSFLNNQNEYPKRARYESPNDTEGRSNRTRYESFDNSYSDDFSESKFEFTDSFFAEPLPVTEPIGLNLDADEEDEQTNFEQEFAKLFDCDGNFSQNNKTRETAKAGLNVAKTEPKTNKLSKPKVKVEQVKCSTLKKQPRAAVQRRQKKNHREKIRRQTMSNKFEELFELLSSDTSSSHGLPSQIHAMSNEKKWNKTMVLSGAIQTIKDLQSQVLKLQSQNSALIHSTNGLSI